MTADYPAFDGTQPCATVDVEAFFPEVGGSGRAAKAICNGGELGYPPPCPFIDPCLQYALHHDVSGVWAGTSSQQRKTMRRDAGIVATPLTFGTATNATVAKRMAGRGTPVTEIAAHLSLSAAAVHRILRPTRVASPDRKSSKGYVAQVACEDCGTKLLRKSLAKHKRDVCQGQVAS